MTFALLVVYAATHLFIAKRKRSLLADRRSSQYNIIYLPSLFILLTTMASATPKTIFGTMTIGPKGQTKEEVATTMLEFFCDSKYSELVGNPPMIDTAIMYQQGETEKVLGKILPKLPKVSIATKANAFTSDKNLSPAGVRNQLEASLESLQLTSVDMFYLHAPDAKHEIELTLEEIQKLFKEGKFQRFALSNFTSWETVYIHSYMSSRSYVLPTIYQGMYNALTRQVESELFPALKKCKMAFYAYNPLAGGMLSGKYSFGDLEDKTLAEENSKVGGRFAGNSVWAKRYRERYQQKQQLDAVQHIQNALSGANMANAALRWMRHHSKLTSEDGIIVGASTISHFESNIESLGQAPLSDDIVKAFDEACKFCKNVCPDYARGYSGSAIE